QAADQRTGGESLQQARGSQKVLANDPLAIPALGTNLLDPAYGPPVLVDHAPAEQLFEADLGRHAPPGMRDSHRASRASTRHAGVLVASALTRTSRPTASTSASRIRVVSARAVQRPNGRVSHRGNRASRVAAPVSSATTRGGPWAGTSSTTPSALPKGRPFTSTS